MLKTFLLAGASLLAMTTVVSADPIITPIASFLFAGPLGAAVSFSTIYTSLQVLAAVGLAVASSVFAPKPGGINPGDFKSTFETGDSSEIRAVGRVRVGGLKAFGNTANGTDRYRLICHVRGPVTAVEEHYFGGREVTVESDGAVSSPPWAKPGGSWAYVKAKIGDGTETAWSDLVTAFPELWTTDHRVRGIAQSLLKYISPGISSEKFMKLYQEGVPDYERVQRSEPVYDPRDLAQDASTESTWEYSDNGPLCAAHILRSYPSLVVADFDYAGIGGEADKAEVTVATKTGTEERSRCWGMWASETPRGDVMDQVLKSIGAEIVPSDDNSFVVRLVDDVRTPEITFTDKHLVDLQWRSGPESVERPNICRVKYYSPERNYDMTEIDLTGIDWARNQEEIDRVGEQIMDIDLPFCPSASQAQRIARRLFALARADAGVATLNFAGLAAWGKTIAAIPLPDLDVTETCAIGTPRVNDQEGTVEIPFVVWPTLAAWDPATMEAAAPPVIPELQYESELDKPAAPAAAAVVQYEDLSYETRVKFVAVTGGTIAEAVYRTYTAGEPDAYNSMTEYSGSGTDRYGWVAADTHGEKVDFKCRFFNANDEGSYYSDVLTVDPLAIDNTAPAAPTFDVTVDDGSGTGTYTFNVSAQTTALNVAKMVIQRFGITPEPATWSDVVSGSGRPEQPLTTSYDRAQETAAVTIQFRAYAYASDGTASTAATYSYIIPGTGA